MNADDLTGAKNTVGGLHGHLLRRLIHMSVVVIPFIYYFAESAFVSFSGFSLTWLLLIGTLIVVIFEGLRLSKGFVVFGQRGHETRQVSSFTWSALSIALVLLFAPGKQYGLPIICSAALADPLVGELRLLRWPAWVVFLLGVLLVTLIWGAAVYWLGAPWGWLWVMGPLTIAAEWPNLKWIDDNALMHLVPLLLVLVFG